MRYIGGYFVEKFEDELSQYMNTGVVTCGNGTDAIQIALMAIGVKPGDEVIVPNFTYPATVEPVLLLGAKPVYVDVDPDTFNIDPDKIEITEKTKAIIGVNLFGQCADWDRIISKVWLIEDNAQSFGAEYTGCKSGTLAHIGTTSFFPSKNLAAKGDGGAIFCPHGEIIERMRQIANHGQSSKGVFDRIGINSRLDAIQAKYLSKQLRKLNFDKKIEIAEYYNRELNEIVEIPYVPDYTTHTYHQYTIKTPLRDEVAKIPGTRIYYDRPVYAHKAYGGLPAGEGVWDEVVSLPFENHKKVCEKIKSLHS